MARQSLLAVGGFSGKSPLAPTTLTRLGFRSGGGWWCAVASCWKVVTFFYQFHGECWWKWSLWWSDSISLVWWLAVQLVGVGSCEIIKVISTYRSDARDEQNVGLLIKGWWWWQVNDQSVTAEQLMNSGWMGSLLSTEEGGKSTTLNQTHTHNCC